MSTVTLTAYRGYQDIGTVGQTVQQIAGNVLSINQILDVGLMNTRDLTHGFVRVEHLIGLGLASLINTNQLVSVASSSGISTVDTTDSISGSGTSGSPLQLVGDVGSPGDDYYYGTNGSGTKGWYVLTTGSGTVTSVGLSDTSTTPIYTVGGTNPVTGAGTIDITLATQSANKVFSGPTTGSAAQPAFRSLVAADLPIGVADSIVVVSSNYQLSGDSASPGNSYYYGTNGSGTKGWYVLTSGSGTVTSIGLSNADGNIAFTGTNPVTSSGTIGVNLSSGAAADLALAATAIQPSVIQTIEAAGWNSASGAVIVTNTVAQDILIPYACTLREVYILTQGGSGSCVVDVWKVAIGSFPPTGANDITGGNPPALVATSVPYTNTTLTGWTTSFAQNDVIRLTLASNTAFTSVKILLRMY
jgi:hypothetical protein